MMEKRRFTRIPIKFDATLTIAGKSYPVEKITNLSIGGCLIPWDFEIAPGTPCVFKIQLAGGSDDLRIDVEGKTTRYQADGLAIHFTKIDHDSLHHLQNLIRYNAPDVDIIEDEIKQHPGLR